MTEREKMLRIVMQEDFCVNEAVLYLDTHPVERTALQYYAAHRDALEKAVAAYEEKYGPLTVYGNTDMTDWQWINNPWPWEGED
ncbi:MAG: spore coat protein CotJB [Clostridia bacterium]|nr:spore coat protein CotJB [Clostridia bacterium]